MSRKCKDCTLALEAETLPQKANLNENARSLLMPHQYKDAAIDLSCSDCLQSILREAFLCECVRTCSLVGQGTNINILNVRA